MASDPGTDRTLFAELAKARLRQVDRAATALAADLGLSPAEKYVMLAAMTTQSPSQPILASDQEAAARQRIHELVQGFTHKHLSQEFVAAINHLWATLERTPTAAMATFYGQLALDETKLDNASVYETALALISLVSWAVLRSQAGGSYASSALVEKELIEEAESHGCPPELNRDLAQYLITVLEQKPAEYPQSVVPQEHRGVVQRWRSFMLGAFQPLTAAPQLRRTVRGERYEYEESDTGRRVRVTRRLDADDRYGVEVTLWEPSAVEPGHYDRVEGGWAVRATLQGRAVQGAFDDEGRWRVTRRLTAPELANLEVAYRIEV